PALHATDLGCAVLRVLMHAWGYPDLASRSDIQQYLDAADQIGYKPTLKHPLKHTHARTRHTLLTLPRTRVALPKLRAWSAVRRPLLLVQAVCAFPSTFLPEAIGVALFLAMWNHLSWQRAQLRILGSRVVCREDKAERRF